MEQKTVAKWSEEQSEISARRVILKKRNHQLREMALRDWEKDEERVQGFSSGIT
jgi:hypothetical protein